jgi:membrane fusion protein (multidrug efflux system)
MSLKRFSPRFLFQSPKRKKKTITILSVFVLIALLLPKILPVLGNVDKVSDNAAPMELDLLVLQPQKFEHKIFATGNLMANYQVNLSAEVPGKIIGLYINEGEEVKEGDLLVKINDNDLQAQLRGAKFELELLEQAESRKKQLLDKGGTTQEDYDAIRGQVNNKRAEIAYINAQIQRTEVRAPFDGFLGLKHVDQGAYVTPNLQIASLQDVSKIKVEFSIPEQYSSIIRKGNIIRFSVQGIDSLFSGAVYAIEPQVDTRSRTFKVRAISDNSHGQLQPGSFADITLVLESIDSAIMVPSIALVPNGSRVNVYKYHNGMAIAKEVTIGDRDSGLVNIVEGLDAADTILVNGLLGLRDSTKVAIREIQEQL